MGLSDLGGPKVVPNGPSGPKWVQVNLDGPKMMPSGPSIPKWPKCA